MSQPPLAPDAPAHDTATAAVEASAGESPAGESPAGEASAVAASAIESPAVESSAVEVKPTAAACEPTAAASATAVTGEAITFVAPLNTTAAPAAPRPVVRPPKHALPPGVVRSLAWLQQYGPLLLVAVVIGLLAASYAHIFAGEPNGDDNSFHLAEARRIADCLAAGDWDFWNWSANGGFASIYYYQAVPLVVPAALTAFVGGDLVWWFACCTFVVLVLAPAASYRGARAMGMAAWPAAACGLATAFAISKSRWGHGADGNFSVGLYTQTWAFAVFPLALGRGAEYIMHGRRLAAAIGWGTLVGLCHPFAGVAIGLCLAAGTLCGPFGLSGATSRATAALPSQSPQPRWRDAFGRLVLLGCALLVAGVPGWLTVVVDYAGFGGFPHRVADEVGPGFAGLFDWLRTGYILDHGRTIPLLTLLAVPALFTWHAAGWRWLFPGALLYGLALGLGPHLVTPDDLFPAVRFLGALQLVLAMGACTGTYTLGRWLWRRTATSGLPTVTQWLVYASLMLAALAFAVAIAAPGARMQASRVHVAADYPGNKRHELTALFARLRELPDGAKQAGPGAENHWLNQLPYIYARRPGLLQMGGGGLQASPNYDFIWSDRDARKAARLYFAPYVMYARAKAASAPTGEVVAETETFAIRRLPDAGLVTPVLVTGSIPTARKAAKKAALAWLKSEAPMQDQVLTYGPVPAAVPVGVGATVTYAGTQPSPGDAPDLVAHVGAQAATTVVVRTSWHPRWHASVDGRSVPVLRVTPDQPAVVIPPGDHVLQLRFARPWWANASWLLVPLMIFAGWLLDRSAHRRARVRA